MELNFVDYLIILVGLFAVVGTGIFGFGLQDSDVGVRRILSKNHMRILYAAMGLALIYLVVMDIV